METDGLAGDLLGPKVKHAFTGSPELPIDGTALSPGEVGYDEIGSPPSGYTISGFGLSAALHPLSSGN